jgi:hypothetical protein
LKDAKGKARSVQAQVFQPLPSVANAGPQLTGYLALWLPQPPSPPSDSRRDRPATRGAGAAAERPRGGTLQ